MPPDADPRPHEWRRAFGPVGATWLVIVGLSARPDRLPHLPPAAWVAVGVAAVLAWAVAGLLSLAAGRIVEWVLLGSWGRFGRPFVRRRLARWRAMAQRAGDAEDPVTATASAAGRNRISLAPPECPLWTGDRWAAMIVRVRNAHGLDVGWAWPRLWLILPGPVRKEMRIAAAAWYDVTVWAGWGVLFLLVGIVWWPSAPIGLMLLAWARGRARIAIGFRADLIESAFDLYGHELARHLGLDAERPAPRTRLSRETMAVLRKGV